MSELKVLVHISDRDKWAPALKQVEAFIEAHPPGGVELIVLADIFAGAVCVACDRRLRLQMEEFVKAGHRIIACEQSLRSFNLRPEALPEFMRTVPNALTEIIRRQLQGFHYIKV
ncbi:MAG: DsrE family protein [Syntrophobacteraceae bacterium]